MNSQNRFHKEYGPVMPWQCKSHSLNTTYMGPLWAFYEFDFLRSEQGMNQRMSKMEVLSLEFEKIYKF